MSSDSDRWGRSDRLRSLVGPVLGRVERACVHLRVEGTEHIPREGGAILLMGPSRTPEIHMSVIRTLALVRELEARTNRVVYWLSHGLRGAPRPVARLWAGVGVVPAEETRAHELIHDGQQLGLVVDDATTWAVETALRAGVPVVPVAGVATGVVVLPPVYFEGRANQRRYDDAVVTRHAERIAAGLAGAGEDDRVD